MTRAELVDMVKTFVNELSPTNGLPIPIDGFSDDRPIDDAIETLLNGASRSVLLSAPFNRLPITSGSGVAQLADDGSARLNKPTDYLRFGSIRLPSWSRTVTEAVGSNSGVALRQGNVFLRAGTCKPVVVDAGTYFQLWPAIATDLAALCFEYVAFTLPEDLPATLQLAVCWQCASLYLQICGEALGANAALQRIEEFLK